MWLTIVKLLPVIARYLIGAMIGGFVVWVFMAAEVNILKAHNAKSDLAIVMCEDANRANTQTIDMLRAEVKKANESCKARVVIKEKLVTRIQEIEQLKGQDDVPEGVSVIDDDVCRALNSVFPLPDQDRVHNSDDAPFAVRPDLSPGAVED